MNLPLPMMFAAWLSLISLVLSGDIEVNPGPMIWIDFSLILYNGPNKDLVADAYIDAGIVLFC